MARGWLNAMLLAGFSIMAALGASQRTPSLVIPSPAAQLGELEAHVARAPGDQQAVLQLTQTFLDRNSPGLALAVLERSPALLQRSPAAADLAATARLRTGQNRTALAMTRQALVLCERQGCDGTTMARNARREELLEAVLADGIEDMDANPEATARAYRKAVRRVQLAMN